MTGGAVRCGGGLIAHVGHQLDVDAAVLGATCGGAVAGYLLILADADEIELVRRDVVFVLQIVGDGISTALAKLVVVVGVANGVGSAGQFKNVAARAGEVGGEIVELRFISRGEHILVEGEGDADIGELLVVIQIGDDSAQAVDAVVSLLRGLVRCIGGLAGSERMLIGGVSRGLSAGDAGLGALVGVDECNGGRQRSWSRDRWSAG